MNEFEAQKQISAAYNEGKRDGINETNELTKILKQFIVDDVHEWTADTWEKFDNYMGIYKEHTKNTSNVYDDLPSDVEPQEYKDDPQGVYEIDENGIPKWL